MLIETVQNMMLAILEETRKRRQYLEETATVTANHRKALVAIEALHGPNGDSTRRLTRITRNWTTTGQAAWQHTLVNWLTALEWHDSNALMDDEKSLG